MIRFETLIGVVGGAGKDRMLLEFHSTVVADDFPEGEILSGKQLRQRMGKSLAKYEKRLREARTESFANKEAKRLKGILGENCEKISEDKEYEVISSEIHLCSCGL